MTRLVLIGNGLSQGFSEELALGRITARVRARLDPANLALLDDVALLAAPEGFEGNAEANFEAMAGPIDRIADAVGLLDLLSTAQNPRFVDLREVATELRRIYIAIVGLIFEEIDRFCVEEAAEQGWEDIDGLAADLVEIAEEQPLHVFTLNYDSLLPSALLHNDAGYYDGFRGYEGALNSPLDPRGNPFVMYQLHGSLAWVDLPQRVITKVGHDQARQNWLPAWAEGEDQGGLPVVVLSDLKSRAVQRHPFDLFYQEFTAVMAEADAVAVAGYGFGDTPVNARLAEYLGRDGDRSIGVFGPHAEDHVGEWTAALTHLHGGVTEDQLKAINCYLPADEVFADWPE